MGRIRTLKPEFPQSESMGRVSREARLLFILLWTLVDDSGRTRAASRMLASLLYPYDDDAPAKIGGWMAELEAEGCIACYEVGGSTYLAIRNWAKHQKIDKPSSSKIPPFSEDSRVFSNPRESSSLDQDQGRDQGRDQDQGKDQRAKRASVPVPEGVPPQVWADFMAHRKAKRAPVSATVIAGIQREAAKAGWTLERALVECMTRGWQSFKADWVVKQQSFANTDYTAGLGAEREDGSYDL